MRWTASTISSNAVAMRIMRTDAGWRASGAPLLPAQPEVHLSDSAALGAALLVDQQRDVEVGVLANAPGEGRKGAAVALATGWAHRSDGNGLTSSSGPSGWRRSAPRFPRS